MNGKPPLSPGKRQFTPAMNDGVPLTQGRWVGPGDIFLFFGWFADVERWDDCRWRRKPGGRSVHALHGWMQVAEVMSLANGTEDEWRHRQWLAGHPHLGRAPDQRNTIYIATDRVSVPGFESVTLAGGGHFERISERLILSAPEAGLKSVWQMPDFFAPRSDRSLSYHGDPSRWRNENGKTLMRSVGRGQEFVIDIGEDTEPLLWLADILGIRASAP